MQELRANYTLKHIEEQIRLLYKQPISAASERIVLTPFYFFTFIIYKDESGVVKEYKRLRIAFDATEGTFRDFDNELTVTAEQDFGPVEVTKQDASVDIEEAKHIVRIMLSHKYSVSLQNIELLRSAAAYWPFCEISLNKPEKKRIKADLFMGKILSDAPKPSFSAILKETLNELKSPKGWLHYMGEILKDLIKLAVRFIKHLMPKNAQQALVLALILLLLVIFITNYG
ncbi:MAG: hypothetical protein J7L44_01160 [Candidatus Diapherotrites archaeon]|nr:hypothetical protein [Candidatus Diapherotrites archaeon]